MDAHRYPPWFVTGAIVAHPDRHRHQSPREGSRRNFLRGTAIFCPTRGRDAVQIESMRTSASSLAIVLLLAAVSGAAAQDLGTLNPQPLLPLAHPDDPKTAAKELFGRKVAPTAGPSHVVGFYGAGCLAGGTALPINGPAW